MALSLGALAQVGYRPRHPTPPMISVKHISRRFASFQAVSDLSFEVERGEVVGFLGLNGAGKTTTMRMLTGYLPPTSGSISIAGHDVLRESMAVRRKLGYLAEGVPLYKEHRVIEMLMFQGRLFGMSRKETKQRAAAVLQRVGLSERSRGLIGNLSKGMRQRVGIAVALLPAPEVLILDEPTSGLDPVQRVGVRELIIELAAERTVMISSHILPEIEAVCGRLIILHRGQKVADGTKAALLAKDGGSQLILRIDARRVGGEILEAQLKERVPKAKISVSKRKEEFVISMNCIKDPSAEVGMLAAERGWILRQLTWHEASLEALFGRLATGVADEEEALSQVGA